MINDASYTSLQAAIDAVKNGETVTLLADCAENITVVQVPEVKFAINGNGYKMTGTIVVDGRSSAYETAGLEIKNLIFTAAPNSVCINLGNGDTNTRYVNSLTVNDCTFIGTDNTAAGIKSHTGGDKNLAIIGCKTEKMHSLAQLKNVDGVTVSNCTITDGKNGVSLGASSNVSIADCKVDCSGYGIRADATVTGAGASIENCTIKAFIPVVVRNASTDYSLTFAGSNSMSATNTDEIWCAIGTSEYEENGVKPTAATGKVKVTLNDTALNADGLYGAYAPVAIGTTKYQTLAAAVAAAKSGDEITLLDNVAEDVTLPDGVIFNGNGKTVEGILNAGGNLTIKGHTKAATFTANGKTITVGEGACLEQTTGRMVIGYGATFNITGSITDAKTADKTTLTPSLISPGASFTGAGVNFNAVNAYIKFTNYCSSKTSVANGTFNFKVSNSIWEQTGKLAFEAPTDGKNPTVNFNLKDSVLTTTSHLVFAVTKGEVVIDDSKVNEGASCQIENRSTMTIKNGSVVNGAVATSQNAINPGTIIVENATYAVKGQFSGSGVGTGTLIVKKGATVSVDSIVDKANVVIDATGMTASDTVSFTGNLSKFTGTLTVINNDTLESKIVDGKIVLVQKPVAEVTAADGTVTKFTTLTDAFKAATEGCTITLLDNVTVTEAWDCRYTGSKFAMPITIDGNNKTLKFTGVINDGYNYLTVFHFQSDAVVKNLTIDMSEAQSAFQKRFSAIANQGNLTVDGCTFIGNAAATKARAIIYGEGASSLSEMVVSVTNSKFENWGYGVTDNMNGKDAKSVTVTGNTFTDSKVVLSAADSVIFTGNTVTDAYVNITSYAANNVLNVTATGNTLTENGTSYNYINADSVTADVSYKGTVVVADLAKTTIKNASPGLKVEDKNGNTLLIGEDGKLSVVVAKIGDVAYASLAEAVVAAADGENINLVGSVPIAMNCAVFGKTVTITGTATVDWSKGWFFVGRGGEGNGKVIFDTANLTSASGDSNSGLGIHVSGREKDTNNKYDGTLEIKNSTIELDYLVDKGAITLDNSTLTVKNGFAVGGRPASETESGEDATATITLNNASKLVVENHNGMGLGYEAIGVMNVNEGCTFEATKDFMVTAKGTLNVNGGTVKTSAKLNNLGTVNITDATVELAKLDNDSLMFLNGTNTFKIDDASGSSYAVRANDGVVMNNSYFKGTANETFRLLGSVTFNGGFECAYLQGSSAGVGGTVTIEDGTVVKATYGVEFSKDYVLNGGSIELSGGNANGKFWGCVFQSGIYEINTDIVVKSNGNTAPIHFTKATAIVNGKINQSKTGGEPIYIGKNSNVTFGDNAEITTDCSVHVNGTLNSNGKVNGKITKAEDTATIAVSGGNYTMDVSDWCTDGFVCEKNEDGSYGVRQQIHLTINVGSAVATMAMAEKVINVATMDEAVASAKSEGADYVTYKISGAVELTTGGSHGIIDLGKNVVIEGVTEDAKLTIVGAGVPDFKGVTFKNITIADEGTYLTTANEFMYQNFIDCSFENVTFVDGIRLSGNSTMTNCTVDANTANEYAIWLDDGEFTMTGTTVIGGADAYGLVKSDTVKKITITDNTFKYLGVANKEALNTKGAIIVANGNSFIDCTAGVIPADKTNYAADGTTVLTEETIAVANTVKATVARVSTKAELNAALANANIEVIILTADIDYGTDQLKIEKPITLDLGGKTLTTRNAWGGMIVKNNPTIKNGNIIHASNTAAIKVWNATAFEDLVIDVQGKGDANKTIGGIVLQSGTTTKVASIKNVTIKGAALTNGIETYNCGDASENVIGSLENVNIDANGTAMLISAPVGTATGCTFDGAKKGVELWIKGTYSASLTLADCDVVGGVSVHDEYNSADITNNGTLSFNADEATTGASATDVIITINHAEESQVKGNVLPTIIENAQAKVNGTYYATLAAAVAAAKAGDEIIVLNDMTIESDLNNAGKGLFNIEADDVVTIDLNGKTINVTDNSAGNFIVFYSYGELTLKNGSVNVTSTKNREWNAQSTVVLNRGGILNIESGSYVHNGGTDMAITVDNSANSFGDAVLNVAGGEIKSINYIGIRNRMADPSLNGNPGNGTASINVTGGYIYGGKRGIWGHITNASSDKLGSIAIVGGTVEGAAHSINVASDNNSNIDISISADAMIKGPMTGDDADYAISGGTFDTAVPEAYCAFGYMPAEKADGMYGVELRGMLAYIAPNGDIEWKNTLVKAADGYTIKLLSDVEVNSNVRIVNSTSATLDLNGKKLIIAEGNIVEAKGTLNVINGGSIEGVLRPYFDKTISEPVPMIISDEGMNITPNGADQYINDEGRMVTAVTVATVGEKRYHSFVEAIAAAEAISGTVTLQASLELSSAVNVGGTVVINLNGKELSGDVAGAMIVNSGSLTIEGDGTVENGERNNNAYTTILNTGTLEIADGATISNPNVGGDDYSVDNQGTLILAGGVIGDLKDASEAIVENDGQKAYWLTIESAIASAVAGDEVKLLKNVELDEVVKIEKAITLNLGGNTVVSTAKKAFEVYANATIKNGAIEAVNRCVDTRTNVEVALVDLKLTADKYTKSYGNPQPITIGGADNGTKIAMENVTVSAGTTGYGIITFVQIELNATNCTIEGYNALYVKPGSEESNFNFVNCDLIASTYNNDREGNAFSAIAIQTDDVNVALDADSAIKANGNFMTAVGMGGSNEVSDNTVSIAGSIEGNILWTVSAESAKANTVVVKAEYAETLDAEGYVTEAVEGDAGMIVVLGKEAASIGNKKYISVEEAFAAANDGDEVKILAAGTYKVPTGKNITITGAVEGVVFDNIGARNMGGANVTFNNVTFDYYPNTLYTGLQQSGNLVYNNCTINGQVFLYGASETFNNCTFNQNSANAYNVWTYGAKAVAFNECEFNSAGKSVLIYKEGNESSFVSNVSVTKSTFNASSAVEGKAAIEMDSSLTAGINLTIDGETTATGFGNGNVSGNSLWNNKKGQTTDANNDITVIVDNEIVLAPVTFVAYIDKTGYTTLDAAIAAAQAGDTVIVKAGTYNVPTMKPGITIEGEGDVLLEGTLTETLENLTLKNLHIKGNNAQRWAYGKGDLVFENVTFEATGIYALHFDGITSGANLLYKDCTIIGWVAMSGSPASCVFDGCTIKGNGNYGVIRTYFDATIKNCTFDVSNVNTTDVYQDGVHAVNGATVTVEGSTNANGSMKDLINVSGTSVAILDGVVIRNIAKIGNMYYRTLQDALNVVKDGETIELFSKEPFADADESGKEIEFDRDIEFTITGKVPGYKAPVITFKNATVTIKDAELQMPELDARQDATINVIDSTIIGCGSDSIVKSYYNGAINILGNSVVHTMQLTTMGYINIAGTAQVHATWRSNIYGNGLVVVEEDASLATASMQLVGKDYNGRDNTDEDRVGKPAQITVDGATLIVGKVFANNGADYSYNSSKGINVGTIDGKDAVLDIRNGANVEIYMANGEMMNIGANGYVNVVDSALSLVARNGGNAKLSNSGKIDIAGTVTVNGEVVNNGTISLTAANASFTAPDGMTIESSVDGYIVDYTDGSYVLIVEPSSRLVKKGNRITLENCRLYEDGVLWDDDAEASLDVMVKLEKESADTAAVSKFANHNVDFLVTFTGVKEACYAGAKSILAGTFGDDGNIIVSLEDTEITEGFSIRLPSAIAGSVLKYNDVCATESEFSCGIYLDDEVLKKNPDIKVTFQAVLSESSDSEPSLVLEDTLTYDVISMLGLVAELNGEYYYSVKEAVADAKDGDTVTLLIDSVETEQVVVPEGIALTIDLNGNTLEGSILAPNADLTVMNGKIVNKDKSVSAIEINAGTLTLENVDIDSARHAVRIDGEVVATIDGGTYRGAIGEGKGTYHALNVSGAADVTVNGGTFVGAKGTTADSGAAVNVQSGAKVTINGGNFSGGKETTLSAKGTLVVMGGTYNQDPGKYLPAGYESFGATAGFGVMKRVALDIKVVDGKPLIGYSESEVGGFVVKGATTLEGDVVWTTLTWTKDASASEADTAKDWVVPEVGDYRFFKGGVAK